MRDEDILLLETRSALQAVQTACERHRNVRETFLLDNLELVLLSTKGRTRFFSCAGRHPSSFRNRIPCQLLMQQKHRLLLDQDSVLATDCTTVPKASFLVSKCLSCGNFSSDLLVSPKRLVLAPVPTTVARHRNHHKRRLTNVAVPAGITCP